MAKTSKPTPAPKRGVRKGDYVVCVEPTQPRTGRVSTIEKGKVYLVQGVRDADLGPPKGDVPDEIQVCPEFAREPYWYTADRFRLKAKG